MKVQSVAKIVVFACFLAACVTSADTLQADDSRFQYNAANGNCVNSTGVTGYNAVDPTTLFAQHDSDDNIYLNGNGECVDFSGYNFNTVIGMNYPVLKSWNFRGAKFARARFSFANIEQADFSGADLSDLRFGYASIQGKGDTYTKNGACAMNTAYVVSCRR